MNLDLAIGFRSTESKRESWTSFDFRALEPFFKLKSFRPFRPAEGYHDFYTVGFRPNEDFRAKRVFQLKIISQVEVSFFIYFQFTDRVCRFGDWSPLG